MNLRALPYVRVAPLSVGVTDVDASSTTPPRGSRTLLLLWGFVAAIGLACAALLCSVSSDVVGSALFGSPVTQVVLGVVFVITIAGVVAGWRPDGLPPRARQVVVLLLSSAAGATAMLAVGFFFGEYADVGILLLQSAILIVVISTRVYRSSTERRSRTVRAP